MQSSPAERRAIGLARALQAGVLSAVAQATPRDLLGLKPVLSAHAAVTTGRQGAAATLREVLRELYPAALRAFPDPAEPIPLAILDALPEPGPLGSGAGGRGRDAQAITELTEAGVADNATVAEAVTALRVAIAETPRRTGMSRSVTSAVAETVRQSVAAVRAHDAAAIALVSVLSARMPSAGTPAQQAVRSRRAATEPAAPPTAAPESAQPAASHAAPAATEAARPSRRSRSQSASVRPRSAPPAGVQPRSAPPVTTPTATPAAAPVVPAAPVPVAPAAAAGNHRVGAIDPPTEVQPAARTRAARRAAENPGTPEQPAAAHRQPTTPASAPTQTRGPAPVPVHTPPPPPVPVQAPPAPIPAPPPAAAPRPVNPAVGKQPEQVRPQQAPNVPPPPGLTPAYATGQRRDPRSEAPTTSFSVAPGATPAEPAASSLPAPSRPSPISGPPSQSLPAADRGFPRAHQEYPAGAAPRPAADVPPPGSRANWPMSGESADGEGRPENRTRDRSRTGETPRVDFTHSLDLPAAADAAGADRPDGRVVPPWQSDDLPAEPPALRLVEPAPLTDPALSAEPPRYREPLAGDPRLEAPPLRLVDRSGGTGGLNGATGGGLNGTPAGPNGAVNGALNGATGGSLNNAAGGLNGAINGAERGRRAARKANAEQSEPPATNQIDEDLLIFAEARSAWFTDHFGEEEEKLDFASPSDEGWKAASHAAEPLVGAETQSGLPRRVPQQNLVPGSPITAPERPLRVVRDPAAIAAHTSGYFQGWRRGQEVGGYRVGGRPGRESSGGWDFSRDQGDERDYEYRSARR
nr:transposase [Planosporangium mesophilum]